MALSVAESTADFIPQPKKLPSHMLFLDGIRGFAALYVVLGHLLQWSYLTYRGQNLPVWFRALSLFKMGNLAVDVFIVLSGFCLMLPVARSGGDRLTRGFGDFIKRRARRILPPYYAALALSLALLALFPGLRTIGVGTEQFHMYNAAAQHGAILSHLLMLHNFNREWIYRLDAPLWSVATEWQIYFLFPLLLLPIRKRLGLIAPPIIGFLLGVATIKLGLSSACFWYLGLFAMGMAGAEIAASPKISESHKSRPWGVFAVITGLVAFAAAFALKAKYQPAVDLLAGLATMSLLIVYTLRVARGESSFGLRLVSSPVAAWLGACSYSLYLIHYPLVALGTLYLIRHHLSTPTTLAILIVVGLPAILAITYAFHLVFERPFMPGHPRTLRQAEAVAAQSPAP